MNNRPEIMINSKPYCEAALAILGAKLSGEIEFVSEPSRGPQPGDTMDSVSSSMFADKDGVEAAIASALGVLADSLAAVGTRLRVEVCEPAVNWDDERKRWLVTCSARYAAL